jgi:hypothetical protein
MTHGTYIPPCVLCVLVSNNFVVANRNGAVKYYTRIQHIVEKRIGERNNQITKGESRHHQRLLLDQKQKEQTK